MTIEIKKTFSSHGCTNMKGCLKCRHLYTNSILFNEILSQSSDAENQKSLVAHACGNDVIIADGHVRENSHFYFALKSILMPSF